jgi:hypothetical protein
MFLRCAIQLTPK